MDPVLRSAVHDLTHAAQWPDRRERIRADWRRLAGTTPAPGSQAPSPVLRLAVRRFPGGTERRLAVGTPPLGLRLLVPDAPVAAEAPVLLVAERHRTWAAAALRRGWAACLVSASDGDDHTVAIAAAHAPAHDGARIAWRAWALSRALDLLGSEPGVDAGRVVVAGHSRNGKAALLAAALDDRFAGVVSSSSGVLGAIPAVLFRERHFGEGVDLLTRHFPGWYHPRLAAYAGREEALPTDAHELLAAIAPTPVLVCVAVNDPVESTWAAERAVASAREAYTLLGAPGALELRWREGGHETPATATEEVLDWVTGADRGRQAEPLHPPGPRPWRSGPRAASPDALAVAVSGTLGRTPPRAVADPAPMLGERDHTARLLGRPPGRSAAPVTADGVDVTVLGPDGGPPALWLGPPCRATGWVAGYEDGPGLPVLLAGAGWRVLAHDPIGSGARVREEQRFRLRHPGWTLLGRMVFDAAAVAELADAPVHVAAYGTGAIVAAHLLYTRPELVARAVLVAPRGDDPLVASAPGYALADLLDERATVLEPEPPGRHRLTAATRRLVVERLGSPRSSPSA